jgi:hypothetical protein
MSEKQNKVFGHPEREDIIKKLLNGESVKSIEAWLKKRHPRKKRLQISYATIQKFRKNHLGLEGEVLEDLKAARREKDDLSEKLDAKAILASSSAYQQKLNEIASNELDGNRKILEMLTLISSRVEHYFNMVSTGSSDLRDDKMLMDLINTQKGLVQDWKKYVDGVADQTVDHNINITVVNEQITVLKSIVFDVLQDLDPDLIPLFVEKVNAKLLNTQYDSTDYNNYNQLEVIDADHEQI